MAKSFDARISGQLTVAKVTDMLVDYLRGLDEEYIPTSESVLCDRESGRVFDRNSLVDDIGLHNGSRIMLL